MKNVTILALGLLIHTGHAATVADFCRDPYAAVCGDQGEAEQAREARIEVIKRRIEERALADLARELPELASSRLTAESLRSIENPELRERALRFYYLALDRELRAALGAAEVRVQFHFERIRARLLPSVRALSSVSARESSAMLARLGQVQLIQAAALLRRDRARDTSLTKELGKSCGADGLTDNAFAFDHEGSHYVVLCPGAIVAALAAGDEALPAHELMLAGVVWVLGHETGHHVDAQENPVTYRNLRGCIARNYASALASPEVDGYMNELSADYWGSEELASYLSEFQRPEERIRVLQESLEFLCGTPDDGSHPDGRFRIENLVRRNPRLHHVLGCEPPADTEGLPSCTLRGEWSRRFW